MSEAVSQAYTTGRRALESAAGHPKRVLFDAEAAEKVDEMLRRYRPAAPRPELRAVCERLEVEAFS